MIFLKILLAVVAFILFATFFALFRQAVVNASVFLNDVSESLNQTGYLPLKSWRRGFWISQVLPFVPFAGLVGVLALLTKIW